MAATSTLWHVPFDVRGRVEAIPAHKLDLSKPCLIYLGGMTYQTRTDRAEVGRLYCCNFEMLNTAPSRYHYYTLTSTDDLDTLNKDNTAYNANSLHHSCDHARQAVRQFLLPLVPDLHKIKPGQRQAAIESAAADLSKITFFGYSYGTVMVQQIRNALAIAMTERGYDAKARDTVLSAVAAVNIGPAFRFAAKDSDFTQLTMVTSNDRVAQERSSIQLGNPHLDFTAPTRDVALARHHHHAMVHVKHDETLLRSIRAPEVTQPRRLKSIIRKVTSDRAGEPDGVDGAVTEETEGHNRLLLTGNFRMGLRSGYTKFPIPTNLVGVNTGRAVGALLEASAHGARDTKAAMNDYVGKHFSKNGIEGDRAQIHFLQRMHEDIGSQHP